MAVIGLVIFGGWLATVLYWGATMGDPLKTGGAN
jgi:hypothetical protein